MRRQIVLDTETTGLTTEDGHRIIEIGCVEIVNRTITGNNYHQYINPNRIITSDAIVIHGIKNEFLQDKPVFGEVAAGFMQFIKDADLIIHNAPFDLGFLEYEFGMLPNKLDFSLQNLFVIDTLQLARKMHPGQRNNLDALCKRYNVDNSNRSYHGALLDALLLAEVYLRMTGGQGSLFVEDELTYTINKDQITLRKTRAKKTVPIIYASSEELLEHGKYLEKMRKEAGKCLWDEE